MKNKQVGFTLLELSICLILFSIFLEAFLGFYTNIYGNYIKTDHQMILMNEGNNVEQFIKGCIRESIKLRIWADGEVVETILDADSTYNQDVVDVPLDKIEFSRMIEMSKGSYQEKRCQIEMIYMGEKGNGKYKLTYEASGKPGANTISDWVEAITVTRYKGSNNVEFKCIFQKKDEKDQRLSYTKCFSVNLDYKTHYHYLDEEGNYID